MKYASIDIGTNTLRLLIAEADEARKTLQPVVYKRAITRLGGGFTADRGIDPKNAERTFSALEEFKRTLAAHGARSVDAVATSVVRRAKNRDWFIDEVLRRTGIGISVITGDEEARLSLLGVVSVIDGGSPVKRLVMDIGGGSTEFIVTNGARTSGVWSMEMGVVHLTERHLKSDPLKKTELSSMEDEIGGVLKELTARMEKSGIAPWEYSNVSGAEFVGTAGTITTLAALDQGLETYDRARINNYVLKKDRVNRLYEHLTRLTLMEREAVLNLEKGREDLIIPGSAITLLAMEAFGFDEIKVSDAGLLEGILLDKTGINTLNKQ